ncbi:MAG: dockerin type I repeat-containing protein, partial [Ruminococcus sp.]|nr:dockerin type I repeat-containing protein [Ruminococcus sp.]
SGDSLTIAYTAQKTDDTVCTGNVSFDKNGDSTRIYDNNLGWVLLLHDASNGEYSLDISKRIPLTTGETVRLYSELGDADGNGSVDIQDATFIQKGLAKFDDVSLNRNEYPERFYAADVNRNGKIDICDVTALQRMIAL